MPRLTIGRYITSEDDCIIPAEFTISFNNVEKNRFEGVFSKYRVLYVDYDTNRLSVRLPDEQKFIPAAAAEIEKLMDYAHLLEEGDMEICEPSEISPEEFIEGINRFSAPSMRSYSKFHHPSDGFFLWNLLMSLRSLGLFHSKEWMKMRISTKKSRIL